MSVVIYAATWATFSAQARKIQKNPPPKNCLIFQEMATKKHNKTFLKFRLNMSLFLNYLIIHKILAL